MSLSSKINDLADRIGQEIKSLWTSISNLDKTDIGLPNVDNVKQYPDSNPDNFEIPSQLDTRDTNNRDRSNHTGTQSVSTITGLSQVAISNLYEDLDNKPVIPNEVINILDFKDRVEEDSGIYEDEKCLIDTIYKLGIIPVFIDHSGYITDYVVTESDVTEYEGALSITESQISDFGNYDNYDNWRLLLDGVEKQSIESENSLNIIPGEDISILHDSQGLTINSTATSNNYNNWVVKINGSATNTVNSEDHINLIGAGNIKIEQGENLEDIVISEHNPNKTNGYQETSLPTNANVGDIAHVTDAVSPAYRQAVGTGGGNETALVFFEGSRWMYH